jgi:hypothetical protein
MPLDAPRARLETEVAKRLDELYATYSPAYPNFTKTIYLAPLLPWESLNKTGLDHAFQRDEHLRSRGSTPTGRHPLHDFRQSLIVLTENYELEKVDTFMLQDCDVTEGMTVKVLCVRFLPPGKKLKPGNVVVCHNLHASADRDLHKWNGCIGTVMGSSRTTSTYTVSVAAPSDGTSAGGGHIVVRETLRACTCKHTMDTHGMSCWCLCNCPCLCGPRTARHLARLQI